MSSQLLRSRSRPSQRAASCSDRSPHPSEEAASCSDRAPTPRNEQPAARATTLPVRSARARRQPRALPSTLARTPDVSAEEASRVRDHTSTAVTSRRTEHGQRVRTVGRFVLNERRGSALRFLRNTPSRLRPASAHQITFACSPGESPLRAACDGAISWTDEPSCVPTARHRAT
jgi:hypothetical protein